MSALPRSAWAAARPEMPDPTIATRGRVRCALDVISELKIKMLRSAPMRTRKGGRRRTASGLRLGPKDSSDFATMKRVCSAAPNQSKSLGV